MADIISLIEKSPCAFNVEGEICLSEGMLDKLQQFHKKHICKSKCIYDSNMIMINSIMSHLGVDEQFQILEHPVFRDFIDNDYALRVEKRERFKVSGPWNNTQLLDNNMIDDTMEQWTKKYKFYHIPFQMMDFYETRGELSKIDIPALIKDGYKTFGCVLNTDVSTGPGKHWFCVMIDARSLPYTIEYFNSSGKNPYYPVHKRMREIAHDINRVFDLKGKDRTQVITANNDELQKSRTECGVWSLTYIYSRLENKPKDWFKKAGVLDEHMIKFRERLFLNE
jgi:hypothetical protein